MKYSKYAALILFILAAPCFAQQSASYKIKARVFNNGGAPNGGAIPASASYKAGAASSGEDAIGPLSSTSFHAELGFVSMIRQLNSTPLCTYFCDDFEDNDDSAWTFQGKGTWDPSSPDLIAVTAKKAVAVSPAFSAPAARTVEANLKFDTPGARVSVFGWYVDKKHAVELRLMPDKHKILLKQTSDVLHVKAKFLMNLNAGQYYNVKVTFDGSHFFVSLDNNTIIRMAPVTTPAGNAAFQVKSATKLPETGSMADIAVN